MAVKKEDAVKSLQNKLNLEIQRSNSLFEQNEKTNRELKQTKEILEAMTFQTLTSKVYYEQIAKMVEQNK
tara:strand:+ start:861 stop:1070 length:210 start_codon:yes stop_codon:yes gene_type:complete